MSRTAANDPLQEELAFASVKAHTLFPGRATLYVNEVARVLGIDEQHVVNLLEARELKGVNIAKDISGGTTPKGRTKSKFWRIPVAAYDEFIEKRRSDKAAS